MDDNRFDRFTRSLDEGLTRRRLGQALAGLVLGGAISRLPSDEAAAKKKKKKKRKKKPPTDDPSADYNACLAYEVSLFCRLAGCASREQSPGCAACFADVETCCAQYLTSQAAFCSCINARPGFFCFSG